MNKSVLQDWVCDLSFMQQSVLIAAVRGPDGIKKDHPVKVLCRWLRRCILLSAFDKRALTDPYEKGGGSFTGPCMTDDVRDLDHAVELYLRSIDELPHHFQLHLMHAAEIIGYKHPEEWIAKWWNKFYLDIVNDAHLMPEYVRDTGVSKDIIRKATWTAGVETENGMQPMRLQFLKQIGDWQVIPSVMCFFEPATKEEYETFKTKSK